MPDELGIRELDAEAVALGFLTPTSSFRESDVPALRGHRLPVYRSTIVDADRCDFEPPANIPGASKGGRPPVYEPEDADA